MEEKSLCALQRALKLGLPAFPCRSDKAPACPHGFKDAAFPESGLATLWARYPGDLVGVPTGTASGFDVLDIDPKNGGREWYEAKRAKLPDTRIHRTRSGGVHILFRHFAGLRNSTGKIALGVDVRADGGYVVWWPAAGLKVKDHLLDQLPEWPLWLLPSLMTPPNPPPPVYSRTSGALPSRGVDGIVRTVEAAPEGRRNCVVYWAACRMRERVADGQLTARLAKELLVAAAHRCGLSQDEASRTIEGALRGTAHG